MHFMNEYEVEEAAARYRTHPILGPATRTLNSLMLAANRHSDGWAYWPAPARAANKLMDPIEGHEHPDYPGRVWADRVRADATVAKLRAAYSPLKAFKTRSGLPFTIYEPEHEVLAPAAWGLSRRRRGGWFSGRSWSGRH